MLQEEDNILEESVFDTMQTCYMDIGMKINEINRAMGLKDLLPEIFSVPVSDKMRFIHQLIKKVGAN